MLTISDRLYGSVTITEAPLIDLLNSRAILRLRGVLQHGISGLLGVTSSTTRYEHSVGVMLLVRRLGGSLEAQAAALLHDVSHTAFSHVMDHVFPQAENQSYHEQIKLSYLSQTEIPALLKHHHLNYEQIVEEANFPLLEMPAPALCADRLDYFLRDCLDLNLGSPAEVETVLNHLVVVNGQMALSLVAVAEWVANAYMAADDASWSNFREVGLYEVTAEAIRYALGRGIITEADLWLSDAELWAKLATKSENQLRERLLLVNPRTEFVWDADNPSFTVRTKIRTIDPPVVQSNGQLSPLSELVPTFANDRAAYLARKAGLWPMRVVSAVAINE